MAMHLLHHLALASLAVAAFTSPVRSDGLRIRKVDNQIGCFDLRTAELVWLYTPSSLSGVGFEVYDQALVVYPDGWGGDKSNRLFLERSTGSRVAPFDTAPNSVVARSGRFFPDPPQMDNGWVLAGYAEGYSRDVVFQASRSNPQVVWEIKTDDYPHNLVVWGDMVFFTLSPWHQETTLFAYRPGSPGPAWKLNLSSEIRSSSSFARPPGPALRSDQLSLSIIGERLLVQFRGQILFIAPRNGKVRNHIDLAGKVPLKFEAGFAPGARASAVLAGDDYMLVVSFDNRVVAMAQRSGRILWHMDPDTFPWNPSPVVHDGRIYLAVGPGYRVETPESAMPLLLGCALLLGLTIAAIFVRARRA